MPNIDGLILNQTFVFLCPIVLFIVMLLNSQHVFNNNGIGGTGYNVLFWTMVFYALFYASDKGGDLYTSMLTYKSYLAGGNPEDLHFEPIYFWVMDLVPFGYVYWRFIIWGLAALVFICVAKKMNCDKHLLTLFMCYYCIPRPFYYQRVSLGFAFLLLGLYFFVEWKIYRCKAYLLYALLLYIVCTFFHRSMPLFIVISMIAVYLPLNRNNWLLYLLLIPVLVYSVDTIGLLFLSQSEEIQSAGISYLDASSQHAARSLGGLIFVSLSWIPFAFITFYSLYDYIMNPMRFTMISKTLLLFGAIMYISSLVLVGRTSGWFIGKMQMQCIFPMTFFLALYLKEKRNELPCRLFMASAILAYILQNFVLSY